MIIIHIIIIHIIITIIIVITVSTSATRLSSQAPVLLEVKYSTLTFPKVGNTRFSKKIDTNVLSIACFTKPGKVRVGVEYLSSNTQAASAHEKDRSAELAPLAQSSSRDGIERGGTARGSTPPASAAKVMSRKGPRSSD